MTSSQSSSERHNADDVHASYSQSSQSTVIAETVETTAAAAAAAAAAGGAESGHSESYITVSDHQQQEQVTQDTSVEVNQPSVTGIAVLLSR